MIPNIKFGTDGWRGVIADDFTVGAVRVVTHGIGNYLKEANDPGNGVVIGYDCRALSEIFAQSSAEVLSELGFKVWVGKSPASSPAVVHELLQQKAQGAIMFSASHNPPIFHGIKYKPYYGGSALTEVTDLLEAHIHKLMPEYVQYSKHLDGKYHWENVDISEGYLCSMDKLIDVDVIRNKNYKIVYDAMHGAGGNYLQHFIPNAIGIRQERNPYFGGINPEPIASNMKLSFDTVLEHNADVGIVVDGDADRIGIVDEYGKFVDSHKIFAVILKHLVERRGLKGAVVKTISTTDMIDKLVDIYSLKLHHCPIGFKYICEIMLKDEVLIGGEESGGIGVPLHQKERDGVFTGLLFLEAMAMSGKTPSQLVNDIYQMVGEHHYARTDLHFKRTEMPKVIELLKNIKPDKVGKSKIRGINSIDGTKFVFEKGWLLLRASGTEPVVRVYSEAETMELAKERMHEGNELIKVHIK